MPVPTASATARPPDWDALARSLQGTLVRPGDPAYDAARVLYNTRFDTIKPQGVARCASADDVRACVAFASQTGVPLALRSGGHSYGGWSTGPGLVIDTGPMMSVDVRADRVVVGAGARLIDVYAKLATASAGVPAGSCPTVGITGLALGGGVGVLSRSWGLTCDDILAADVVTADGRALTCDAQREPELYWAIRGGGGSFGAVTSLTLRTHPTAPRALASLAWSWTNAPRVVAAWQDWQRQAPDTLWSNLHLDAAPTGDPTLTLYAVHAGDAATLNLQLDRLDAMAGVRAERSVGARSFMDTMLVDAGCLGRTVSECHLRGDTPDGVLGRDTYVGKSIVAAASLSTNAISALLVGIHGPPADTSASVIFDALGGAVGRVGPDATAFPHRSAIGVMQFVVSWSAAKPATEASAVAWLRSYHDVVRAEAGTAAYANYADPDLTDWPQAYYGANYARLQRVKRMYDPNELFRFPQSIRPA